MPLTILVTGATAGIGRQTARDLAARGHALVLHGRDPARLSAVAAEYAGAARVETALADLTDLDAVRRMADAIDELDVLVNNAGVWMAQRAETSDGFEVTLAVNHIAPFVLTHALLPRLLAAPQGRIVNVSSIAHTRGRIRPEDPHLTRGYDAYTAYARSKLANVLLTRALHRRLAHTSVTVNALHPGVVETRMLREAFGIRGQDSLPQGAATSVRLATDPTLAQVSGRYFSRGEETEVAPHAQREEDAEWLYRWTAQITGTVPLPLE